MGFFGSTWLLATAYDDVLGKWFADWQYHLEWCGVVYGSVGNNRRFGSMLKDRSGYMLDWNWKRVIRTSFSNGKGLVTKIVRTAGRPKANLSENWNVALWIWIRFFPNATEEVSLDVRSRRSCMWGTWGLESWGCVAGILVLSYCMDGCIFSDTKHECHTGLSPKMALEHMPCPWR